MTHVAWVNAGFGDVTINLKCPRFQVPKLAVRWPSMVPSGYPTLRTAGNPTRMPLSSIAPICVVF